MPNTTAHSSHPEARRAGAAAGTEGIARSSRSASLAFLASTPQQHPATAPYAPTPTPPATNSGFVVTSRGKPYLPPLLHASPFPSSPSSPHPDGPLQAKTTLHLSSSVDAKGRRMVNQYVRLKTIGQGSHGKVWLCAEPTLRESDEDSEKTGGERTPEEGERRKRREGKDVQSQWEEELETGDVKYCAIKSVAREGVGRGKSLRMAKGRKAEVEGGGGGTGIGADDKVKREVAIMKRLDHKHVVRLREVIDDSKSKKVFMVLEFMAGGQVVWQDVNKRPALTVDEARRTFRDVVLGLEYLHYQGIIHRDIKPANLLWTEDHSTVKISDFGVSHVSDALLRASPGGAEGDDDKALRKTAGSPAFFAPELCHPAEYTPTPQTLRDANEDDHGYFSVDAYAHASGSSNNSLPSTPNGLRLTTKVISLPLSPPSPSAPRLRPTIGKGIDVWALGVTLFCLLFGDTPFMARTEYELYNVIVREGVRVPESMGREGAWTGIGKGWERAGDGVEGREVVDLLGKLLEKDPKKRIGLAEVKKHPWVLRNLSSSADSWLCDTDPAQTESLKVTEEDVEHATQERGAVDAVPRLRNRPGIRNALNAALVRFPAFSRVKSRYPSGGSSDHHSRSKSVSSNSQSAVDGSSEAGPSRHPSDGASRRSQKGSNEFGMDLRRIITGSRERDDSPGRVETPAPGGGRGGWGSRSKRVPSDRPVLVRSLSASSAGASAASRHLPPHLLSTAARQNSEDSRTPSISSQSTRGSSPNPGSDTESTGRRTLSKMLSRLGGGRSKTPVPPHARSGSVATVSDEDVHVSPLVHIQALPPTPPADSRLFYNSRRASGPPTTTKALPSIDAHEHADTEDVDTSDFEYSSDEDNDDDFALPPVGQANGITGWQGQGFPHYAVGVQGEEFSEGFYDDYKPPRAAFAFDESTPRAVTRGIDPDPSTTPPPLVRQSSDTPSKHSHHRSSPGRDGSIRNGIEPGGGRKWQVVHDDSEEDDETEIFVAPRRRRVAT